MLIVIATLCTALWLQGKPLEEMFLLAVALAVAAIPEGLPAAITIALSVGMRRMSALRVIIRKLVAVEALGSCTFIASDKTGTLTVNELTARRLILPSGKQISVTGEGLTRDGIIEAEPQLTESVTRLCKAGVFANESELSEERDHGDMVDLAFLVLGRKAELERHALLSSQPERQRIAYESAAGFSAAIHGTSSENAQIYVKGSAEKLLPMCTHMLMNDGSTAPIDTQAILNQMESLAKNGYRVLAVADGAAPKKTADANLEEMTFLGIVGMIDPLRPEAKEAVTACHRAGIEVAMITGDHPATARAISYELGLCEKKCKFVTGPEIDAALAKSPEALQKLLAATRIFARIAPAQKKNLLRPLCSAATLLPSQVMG